MTLIDIAPKSPFAEPVQDALPVRLPSGLKATEVLGTLEDPREHAKGPQDVVLRLREEGGANILQVTDAFGALVTLPWVLQRAVDGGTPLSA